MSYRFIPAHAGGRIAAMALAAVLAAAPAAARDRLIVAQPSDALTLDPSMETSPIGVTVYKNIFDQLTEIQADGSVAPLLATSWQHSDNATVWTFQIRQNAKFHNGEPITLDDVVWSYSKVMADKKTPVRTYLSKVKSVEAVDGKAVRFTLTEPFIPFDRQVSLISILPKKAYEEMGSAKFGQMPVGSGPFKVVRWVRDDQLVMEAFADYWAGAPELKQLVLKPVPSDNSRAAALASGELDIVPVLPPSLVERLDKRPGIHIEKVQSSKVIYLGLDPTNKYLADIKLRQAIDLAIDREAITKRLLRGLGVPTGQVVAPVTFGYDPTIKPAVTDVAKAKALVAESSYKGETIVFEYPNNSIAFGEEVAQGVAGFLKAVGINVEMRGMEYTAFLPLWANRKLNGIHMFAYTPSILDADLPLTSLYETGRSRGNWSNAKADELIRAQRAEADRDKRKAIIGQIWRLSRVELPYVPLYNEIQAYGIRDGVKWRPRPDERLVFKKGAF